MTQKRIGDDTSILVRPILADGNPIDSKFAIQLRVLPPAWPIVVLRSPTPASQQTGP